MRAKLFISYCHKDKIFQRRFQQYLVHAHIHGDILDDTKIRAGVYWKDKIRKYLASADLYVCFLSIDYYASPFISKYEIPEILRGMAAGKKVLTIYVGPIPSQDHSFLDLQGLNSPDQALISMNNAELEDFYNSATIEVKDALHLISCTPSLLSALKKAPHVHNDESFNPNKISTLPQQSKRSNFTYNIVIVGRTGVGKSELFNYLFGKEIQPVGTGKPVTQRGFHRHKFELKGFFANLFDSWGLEHGKQDDWQRELEVELRQRSISVPPDQWFHTVLFCIDATSERFQEFEANTIKIFQNKGCSVVVVLTKSDLVSQDVIHELRKTISEIIGEIPCVSVASKGTKLSIGMTHAFGIQDLVDEILLSFANSVANRVPARCCWRVERIIDDWQNHVDAYIRENAVWYNEHRVAQHLDEAYKSLVNHILGEDGLYSNMLCEDIETMIGIRLSIEGLFGQSVMHSQLPIGINIEERKRKRQALVSSIKDSVNSDLSRVVTGLMTITGALLISNIAIGISAGILVGISITVLNKATRNASKQAVQARLLEVMQNSFTKLRESVILQQNKSEKELRNKILITFHP